ncbi:BspA family leucine-rich repeat surface protein [Companilactobacillus keshanensis]|uniref:BspA family leucine-rich repeat surface protein n=1 Tax=Companilactobacillus keshanensis TaxID=2486003 RepID=A0ABW4BR40_9LACO|nr:BspA family leucine-rich repeat surface protein [Companilactobacillus keshanensis]
MKKGHLSYKVSANIKNKISLFAPAIFFTGILAVGVPNTVKAAGAEQMNDIQIDQSVSQSDIASSTQYGNIGANDGEKGSSWVIDSQGVLRIQEGTWGDDTTGDFWSQDGLNYLKNDVTAVVFEGTVTAGTKLDNLFKEFNKLESVSVEPGSKFDISRTTSIKKMFDDTSNLKDFDMKILNDGHLDQVEDASYMFENSGLQSVSMDGVLAPKLSNAGSMFVNCDKLTKASFNGTEFGKDGINMGFFLKGCSSLKDVSFNNSDFGKLVTANNMFSGDSNIEQLDVSSFDWSGATDYDSMFSFNNQVNGDISKLNSITLPANAKLDGTGIDEYDTNEFKGWGSDDANNVKSLADYYSANDVSSTKTWSLAERDAGKYTINYLDDSGKSIAKKEESGYIDDNVTSFPKLLGYSTPTPVNSENKITGQSGQEFDVIVKKLEPYSIKIIVEYGDGTLGETFDVSVPFGVTDPAKQIDQAKLSKFDNNGLVNTKNSQIYIGSDTSSTGT